MDDCIYSPHCIRSQCDLACPLHAEIAYWMSQCDISMKSPVLHATSKTIDVMSNYIQTHLNRVNVLEATKTLEFSDLVCYCCICMYGQKKAFSNGVYNLNFSEFTQELRRSWQLREEPELLQMMRIWADNASYLVISHLDYVQFNDFECQTLLRLIQDKEKAMKTTFIIIPKKEQLIGKGPFFNRLLDKLKEVSRG